MVTMPEIPTSEAPKLECDMCTRPAEFVCACPPCKADPLSVRPRCCNVHRDDFDFLDGVVWASIEEQEGGPK